MKIIRNSNFSIYEILKKVLDTDKGIGAYLCLLFKCGWMLLHYDIRVELLWKLSVWLQNLNYLLSGHVQKGFADPCYKYVKISYI
jgi:hypothetical protein